MTVNLRYFSSFIIIIYFPSGWGRVSWWKDFKSIYAGSSALLCPPCTNNDMGVQYRTGLLVSLSPGKIIKLSLCSLWIEFSTVNLSFASRISQIRLKYPSQVCMYGDVKLFQDLIWHPHIISFQYWAEYWTGLCSYSGNLEVSIC